MDKYWGFDPEISSGGTSLGVDRGIYPQARTYTIPVQPFILNVEHLKNIDNYEDNEIYTRCDGSQYDLGATTSCNDNFLEVENPSGEPLEEYYTR